MTSQLIDLSHRIEPGMFTHPGLPGPTWQAFRTREEYRESSGTDFQIDQVTMVGNTGTYLDSPFHRFADGGDQAWGGPAYAEDAPFLSGDGAAWLLGHRPALVGIDSVNIDDLADPVRPAHTQLLGAGVLVLEHLTGLAAVPARGARLHAAPPPWSGVGTWPVRAYAVAPGSSTA